VEFLSSCAVWNRSCSCVEVPEFGFRYVCGGGAAGVVEKSRRFCVNLVRVVDLRVVLSVEPVERSRVCVTCWYGELNRVRCIKIIVISGV